ncbi:MAG TPA: 4-(cytidine 5'-diphospho)-2-C-methyl-D-erythritol kinase [Burkholderiaceae bacterium]|nr:4-(cytidine 5'-diphospho)-2-C-methyl-D-erythritol kinase [Burkholderiaceae bacterium]
MDGHRQVSEAQAICDRLLALPAPAKLNLFLHVVGRRDDGYHLLQTVFRFIDLCDEIDLVLREDGVIARTAGPSEVAPETDLVVRAAHALRAATGCTLGVDIAVRKRIPMGGGLGGGSSNAATVLIGLNRLWRLGLSRQRLQAIGLALGADVPVFVFGRSAFAEGVGERLQPITLPPTRYLVVWPGVGVPTATIFNDPGLTRNTPAVTLASFSEIESVAYAEFGRNDLESVASSRFREVRDALNWLRQFGPSRMSGSGGCCFTSFKQSLLQPTEPPPAPSNMQAWCVDGIDIHPLAHWVHDEASP